MNKREYMNFLKENYDFASNSSDDLGYNEQIAKSIFEKKYLSNKNNYINNYNNNQEGGKKKKRSLKRETNEQSYNNKLDLKDGPHGGFPPLFVLNPKNNLFVEEKGREREFVKLPTAVRIQDIMKTRRKDQTEFIK